MSIDQLLKSAFQLAYFIHADKETAIEITIAAIDRLDTASDAQDKRFYYRPSGRTASPASRTRVSLSRQHLLQRLVYIESEHYERLEEQRPDAISQQVLLIYFLKHLVRITLKRNSFYVLLGLSRLLCNYTTTETMEMYNFLIQDPDRIREDTYYRMRKMQLMREMMSRFGSLLRICKNSRREARFQSQECTEEYCQLWENSMIRFTPWDTQCILPNEVDPASRFVDTLLFKGKDPDDEHVVEVNRIHTVLHPGCYRRLTELLGLDPPEQRVEIPLFFTASSPPAATPDRNDPPELQESDIERMKGVLRDRARRRKKSSGELLLVLVDRKERAQWNLREARRFRLEIDDGSELIEIRRVDEHGAFTIASYLLQYDEAGIMSAHQTVVLNRGQKFNFDISAPKTPVDQAPDALVTIEYEETNSIWSAPFGIRYLWKHLTDRFFSRGWRVGELIKSPLLLAMVTFIAILTVYLRIHYIQNPQREIAPEAPASTEENNNRSQPLPNRDGSTNQNLNASTETQKKKAPGGKTPGEGERVTDSTSPRSLGLEEKSASLVTVKLIYVDPFGTSDLSRRVRDGLIEALQNSNRISVTQERGQADGVLEGSAKAVVKGKNKVDLRVQIVNTRGEVIWPLVKNTRYAGDPEEVATSVVRDLLGDIERLERKK